MKDFIENFEDAAEEQYFKMLQPDGRLRCRCGKLFDSSEGQPISANPYSMPVCGDCFDKQMKQITIQSSRQRAVIG
uniref:Uncharacterized protein n=1 Tax=viral metagenome TaxID=1070528 RepID=A0A6H1ZLG7_9ZZZZ